MGWTCASSGKGAGSQWTVALAIALACWRAKGCERKIGERGDGRIV